MVIYNDIMVVCLCDDGPCKPPWDVDARWLKLRDVVRALRFRTRWIIIEYISDGERTSMEIYNHLIQKGEQLTKPGFYYHLSELKNANIIEIAGYIDEGGGAPEKIWKLKTKRIVFNLLRSDEKVD